MLSSAIPKSINTYEKINRVSADVEFINKVKTRYGQIERILKRIMDGPGGPDTMRAEDGICAMLSSLSVEAKFKKYQYIGNYPEAVFSSRVNSHVTAVRQYFMSGDFSVPAELHIDDFLAGL